MKYKFIKILFFSLILFSITSIIKTSFAEEALDVNDDSNFLTDNQSYLNYNSQIIIDGNYIIIKIISDPPLYLQDQRREAYKILQPYLTENLAKASVVWQKNKFSYGKIASIPNVYIRDYLNNNKNIFRINKFISQFSLLGIEPEPVYSRSCSKVSNIPQEMQQKSMDFVDKAELYRLSGKNDSAKRIYNQALEINPENVVAIYWLAEIYKSEKNNDKAEEFYNRVTMIDPCFWAARQALDELKSK